MAAAWWPWAAVILLGFYHGINPGMGWLFAVGRGLQEQSRRAVLGSLLPIAAGHELSVVAVIVLVAATQAVVPPHVVRLVAALVLITAGLYTLARPRRHPRGMGMRIGVVGLAVWSFLMSSAHGAGLMLAPVLFGLPLTLHYDDLRTIGLVAFVAAVLHLAAMLVMMSLTSVVIYEKVGLGILRRGWFNLDLLWSGVLLLSGVATLFTVDPGVLSQTPAVLTGH
ncbi:MAG TPA: hypothetical protein VFA92_11595 [Candidatus Binatia bacterium]|jgi:hypothetical protein|nr:hypothetical protein [Candidatus Binatia bacterium]